MKNRKTISIFAFMTILIDSAIIPEVKSCFEKYPWVQGLSSNPKLLNLAASQSTPEIIIETLVTLSTGVFYYQVTADTESALLEECKLAESIVGDRLIIKIMPSDENYAFTHKYHKDFTFCFTAVHNLTQAKLAHQAGAKHITVYVNRMLKGDLAPYKLMQDVCTLFPNNDLQIMAASIKTIEELELTLLTGAQYQTLPFSLIEKLASHPMTDYAANDFKETGAGIL